jgi:hypothetical protein
MNTNETKFQYDGTALGSFDFVGTKAEFEKMLSELREVAPEFTGEIAEQYTRDGKNHLVYDGEFVATEIE